jgi:hypothetical protein
MLLAILEQRADNEASALLAGSGSGGRGANQRCGARRLALVTEGA